MPTSVINIISSSDGDGLEKESNQDVMVDLEHDGNKKFGQL